MGGSFSSAVILLLVCHVVASQVTVPAAVLEGGDANVCPSVEMRQEARQNLSATVRDTLSRFYDNCGPGRWTQVVSIDMSDPTQQCPSPWTENSNPSRSCSRPPSGHGCSQVSFSTGLRYSKVCGRATGLAVTSPDAFATFGPRDEENYVDGISLTHSSPRQHIWTFAADHFTTPIRCPCSGDTSTVPDFVGDDYFCDSRQNGALWDGEGCLEALSCCSFNSPPWFSVQLSEATGDAIDVRICGDEHTSNENTAVQVIELYVQ